VHVFTPGHPRAFAHNPHPSRSIPPLVFPHARARSSNTILGPDDSVLTRSDSTRLGFLSQPRRGSYPIALHLLSPPSSYYCLLYVLLDLLSDAEERKDLARRAEAAAAVDVLTESIDNESFPALPSWATR
jgi:hypothetical protein